MKAVLFREFGNPDVLSVEEARMPVPAENDVLIKVYATAINDWDLGKLTGKPYFTRLFYGFWKPKHHTLGCDVAGVVESTGAAVTRFKVGDRVYGDLHGCGFGAFAQYVCADENALESMPGTITFEEAAAIPHAATLAWQAYYDKGQLRDGMSVLINGAGGGVGAMALQLAKQYDIEVTGVDSEEKLAMLTEIGFDHVIDYQKEDFTENGRRYDLILDVKTTRSAFVYLRALNPDGIYVTVGGHMNRVLQIVLLSGWIAKTSGKHVRVLGLRANRGLAQMAGLIAAGKIKPLIDGPYKLDEVADAMWRYVDAKQTGRIVLVVD
jgi:NADPH:quinone reductase-like Zn-dependent oxidoreductase